jgi:hypothetical protein
MSQHKLAMIGFCVLLLLAFSAWTESVNAQPASTPSGDYGGPFMSNPEAQSPEELKREIQIREEYCRTHPPGACIRDLGAAGIPLNIYHGTSTLDPANSAPAVTTSCRPDPAHPAGPQICTACRSNPADPEHPVCVRLIAGEGVAIPPLPSN